MFARLSSWCQFAVYFAAVRLVRRLPRFVATRAGRALGHFSYLVLPRRRRLAARNVALALLDRSAAERRRITRASFVELGKTYWETAWAARLSAAELLRRVDVEGGEPVEDLREDAPAAESVVEDLLRPTGSSSANPTPPPKHPASRWRPWRLVRQGRRNRSRERQGC